MQPTSGARQTLWKCIRKQSIPSQELVAVLEEVAEITTERQLKDKVGISLSTIAIGEEVHAKRMSVLLFTLYACDSGEG